MYTSFFSAKGTVMPNPSYIHGTESSEQDRLEIQHRLIGGSSFLPPLQPGMKLLEVGSGTGAIAREVSSKIAPGTVVGVDSQPVQVEKARALALSQGIGNAEFRLGKANVLEFPDGTFDLAYCRFLLEHVRDPVSVVKEMARTTKPGGTVVACECLLGCCSTTEPPIPNASRALDALYRLQKLKGGDPHVAEKLEHIFMEAGLENIQAETLAIKLSSLDEIRGYAFGGSQMLKTSEAELLDNGLLSRDDLDRTYREWEDFARAHGAVAWFKLRRVQGTKSRESEALLKADVIILYVENIQTSRRFYEDILGFKPRLDAGSYCELDLGGIGLGLMPKAALPHFLGDRGGRPWMDGAPRCELYLLTEQPASIINKLEKAGAKLLSPLAMRPWGDEVVYFEDPDGHVLAVARRTRKFNEVNYPWIADGIRPIAESDRPKIAKFLTERWGNPQIVTRGRVHQADQLPGFIAYNQERIAGLITLRIDRQACEGISLDSLCEGRGLGSKLLAKGEEFSRSHGCRRLWLVTTNDNTSAIRFYQKRGYRVVAVHRDAVTESRRLKPSIPKTGASGILIQDEVELEKHLL